MLFQADITIPKNTTEASPTIVILKIGKGIITKFMIRPRPGHSALAHLVIQHHEHQIAPSTENMDFHGDADPIDWEDHLEVLQPPFELKLQGWNTDDTYPHTFTVYVVVLPQASLLVYAIVNAIRGLFGGIIGRRVFTGGG